MIPIGQDILNIINGIAPYELAESWDNSGFTAGDLTWPVQKIMVGLDPSMPLLTAASAWEADMVVTHHPLFITPEKTIDFRKMPGSAIALAARERISIVSAHTNLDKAEGGLNDYFASLLDIRCDQPLLKDPGDPEGRGIGRIGTPLKPMGVPDLVSLIKKRLGMDRVRVVGNPDRPARRIAICTGSGGSLLEAFFASDATVYITGDIKYHEARETELRDYVLIDVGHFASEIVVTDLLSSRLKQACDSAGFHITIKEFKQETDPFTLV